MFKSFLYPLTTFEKPAHGQALGGFAAILRAPI